jgi:ribose-phosphate pyrophosphokinase
MAHATRPLKIFSGSSHPLLAQEICDHLGLPLGKATTTRFSNENLKIKIEENVREQDVFVVQTACPPLSEHIIELLIMIDALKHASARRVTAVIPYFFYARSDKKDEPRISITARLMADLLAAAGADRVLTMDLHSPQIQGFFSIPADQLTAVPALCQRLLEQIDPANAVVIAADVGEAKDAGRFAKRLELPLAIIDKRRTGDDENARPVHVIGDIAGRHCVLVDDEIATGGTLFNATDFLLERGARSVSAAVVHPVLSGRARQRLDSSRLERLLVTNTLPIPDVELHPKLEVLSLARELATAILHIHDGRSVSALFS